MAVRGCLKVKARKVKGKKGEDGKGKKGSSNVALTQSEAQAAVDVPALPASFFAVHHIGSPVYTGELDLVAGAAFSLSTAASSE